MVRVEELAKVIRGDVSDAPEVLDQHARDTSIFRRTPSLVVFPKDASDVSALARYVHAVRERGEEVSLTARAAGTCMSGGPLSDSIVVSFTKHMHAIRAEEGAVVAEPGAYCRDIEKATLARDGSLIPPYPASRELCALGGMLGNDAGGELSLRYGKMHDWVESLDVVLSDGTRTTLRPLSDAELAKKKAESTLEGEIYRRVDELIEKNKDIIRAARPSVSKNSAGYALWNVRDEARGTFDLSKLVIGSQGTLALVTSARVRTAHLKQGRAMLVVFLSDMSVLPALVKAVLAQGPETLESYDDKTFALAGRFAWQFIRQVGLRDMFALALSFIPEVWMTATGGIPRLVIIAEFAEETEDLAQEKARAARAALEGLPVTSRLAFRKMEAAKYWKIRRESFALLRKNVKNLHAAAFIDDIVVHPDDYPEFLPALYAILGEYDILFTIAGHVGNGNFHIIPLIDLNRPEHRKAVLELMPRVYELVTRFKGSITGEHGDGIVRTPFLPLMFGEEMCRLFAEVKRIFDPLGVFNPGKKTGGTLEDVESSMLGAATTPREGGR